MTSKRTGQQMGKAYMLVGIITFCVSGIAAFSQPPGMVQIPAGSYMMGNATNVFEGSEGRSDERPWHLVHVSGFFMDQHEVTKDLWDAVRDYGRENGYLGLPSGKAAGHDHPVHTVSWLDVTKWCNARSEKEGYRPVYYQDGEFTTVFRVGKDTPHADWSANGYRLPTEAEWEMAARGGAKYRRFSWSDTDTIQHARANYTSSGTAAYDDSPTRGSHPSCTNDPSVRTCSVGSFEPNDYGLYDMTGNVLEWCWDRYGRYDSHPEVDTKGHNSGAQRSIRGGCWTDTAGNCRVSARLSYPPVYALKTVGFRTVISSGDIVEPAQVEVYNEPIQIQTNDALDEVVESVEPVQNDTNKSPDEIRKSAQDELEYYLDAYDVPSLEDF